jgi:hypothetical protein
MLHNVDLYSYYEKLGNLKPLKFGKKWDMPIVNQKMKVLVVVLGIFIINIYNICWIFPIVFGGQDSPK